MINCYFKHKLKHSSCQNPALSCRVSIHMQVSVYTEYLASQTVLCIYLLLNTNPGDKVLVFDRLKENTLIFQRLLWSFPGVALVKK